MKADVVVVKVEPGEVVEAGQVFLRDESSTIHMGPEDPSNRKKYPSFLLMPKFQKLQDDSKNVSL